MKRTVLLLTLIIALLLCQAVGFAQILGDFVYEPLEDGTVCITGYTGEDNRIDIPDQFDGIKVTGIADAAFIRCEKLTGVVIPDSVTMIGDSAFSGCRNLLSVTIPDSVIMIGEDAFMDCENLMLTVTQDSFAEEYARVNGIRMKYLRVHDCLKD